MLMPPNYIVEARLRNSSDFFGPDHMKPPLFSDIEEYVEETPLLRQSAHDALLALSRQRGGCITSNASNIAKSSNKHVSERDDGDVEEEENRAMDDNSAEGEGTDEGEEDSDEEDIVDDDEGIGNKVLAIDVSVDRLAARRPDELQKDSIDVSAEKSSVHTKLYCGMDIMPLKDSEKTPPLFNIQNYKCEVLVNIKSVECTYVPFDELKAIADGDIAEYQVRKWCQFYVQKGRHYKKLHKYSVFDGYSNPTYKVCKHFIS